MKRKINESLETSLKIDVVNLSNDFPEISVDKLATELSDNLAVNIRKAEEDGTVFMIIDNADINSVIDEMSDIIYATDSSYDDIEEIRDILTDSIMEMEEDETIVESYEDFPEYDDVDIEYEDWEDEDDPDWNLEREIMAADDLRDWERDSLLMGEDEEFDDDDALNDGCIDDDCDDEFDECDQIDDKEFECYESKRYRYRGNGIYEKKKGCCPPRKRQTLLESLKHRKNSKLSIRDIVRSAKSSNKSLSESVINRAIKKAKNEKIKSIKESLGTEKYNMIVKAMKSGKRYLYENKRINGKLLSEYTSKELYDILKTVQEQINVLKKKRNKLNESSSLKEEIFINEKLDIKQRLINILDEELTYRLTLKKLLKEEDNPLEPLSVDPTKEEETKEEESKEEEPADEESKDEEPEEDEEVELSRVVITVANQEAADELKASMVDAGIPEDAIEFESESDEEETEEGSEEGETEEGSEEGETEEGEAEESSEEGSKEQKESLYYNKFKKLLEEDGDEEGTEDAGAEGTDEEGETEDGEAEEGEDEEADETIKVVLTNTDYISDLADVLDNEYGITKDEFEEMIGGEIIEDENSDEDSDNEESDKETSDDKEDSDEESSKGDDAVDAMTPEELDKLFGNN